MHRADIRSYTGAPGEQVTVTATVAGSGSIKFVVDGQDKGGNSPMTFNLPNSAGQASKLSVALLGAVGESCVVDIAVVDGGSDKDRLKAQPDDPFPVHSFDFATVAATELAVGTSAQRKKGGN